MPPRVVILEREEAISSHNKHEAGENRPLLIYTDGSGYMGYIGSAMVVPETGSQMTQCLGTEATSTVYAAEVNGIYMALQALLRFNYKPAWHERTQHGVVIFSDSQAALKTLLNPRMVSGQFLVQRCLDLINELEAEGYDITFQWTPGHENIPGNEAADRAAKRAALVGVRKQIHQGEQWIWLASAAKRRIQQAAKDAWGKTWEKGTSVKPTRKLIKHMNKRTLLY